jgi:UDP-N-acetylglucosamine 2-epimerase (non-hydrolysing)
VFPVHKRTRTRLKVAGLAPAPAQGAPAAGDLRLLEPLGYIDFLALMDAATLVLTDSGGVQEETTVLGTPCLTVRDTTERPVTVEHGTNQLVDPGDEEAIVRAALAALDGGGKGFGRAAAIDAGGAKAPTQRPPLWDGRAGERIAAEIAAFFTER